MLVLFDIDMTMITTARSGMAAMADAGRELFGQDFTTDRIEFAGRLDPLIVMEICHRQGVPYTPDAEADFRARYARHLHHRLIERKEKCRALPGVLDLLHAVRADADLTLGVLTGNYAETGSLKLRACGIDPAWFTISVWGDESTSSPPTRDDLPRVALSRWTGPAHRAVIVGDTHHDIRCAKVNGLRALAVATELSSAHDHARNGADLAVDDLTDTQRILKWFKQ